MNRILNDIAKTTIETLDHINISPSINIDAPDRSKELKMILDNVEERIGLLEVDTRILLFDNFREVPHHAFRVLGTFHRYRAYRGGGYLGEHAEGKKNHYWKAIRYYKLSLTRLQKRNASEAYLVAEDYVADLHLAISICYTQLKVLDLARHEAEEAIKLMTAAGKILPAIYHETLAGALMYSGKPTHNSEAQRLFSHALTATDNPDRILYNLACNKVLWGNVVDDADRQQHYADAIGYLRTVQLTPEIRNRLSDDEDMDGLRKHTNFDNALQELLKAI